MHIPILNDIIIIFLLSVIVIYLFNKLKIPAIIGFLLTGVIIGPKGLSLINSVHQVEILAEIGVILFLFALGIEFSISRLSKMKNVIIFGGGLQVLTTIAVFYVISTFFGLSYKNALFMGFLTSLSSTAIILKLIQSKGLLGTPQGNTGVGILLFQDIAILPMFLIIPLLAGTKGNVMIESGILLLKVAAIILFLYISIKFIIPKLMYAIAQTRIKELFYVTVLLICFLIVYLASLMGVSLALGAFLAGLIISETEYNHEALGIIEPFRDVFTSFFFVSVGMLLNIGFVYEHFFEIIGLVFLIIIVKAIITTGSVLILKYPLRIALMTGIFLAQIGEFSFILSKLGLELELIQDDIYQKFLAVAVMSMSITPFLFSFAPKIVSKIKSEETKDSGDQKKRSKTDLLIIGFGLNGKNISLAAKKYGINYNIIEMNPQTVKKEKEKNENIIYGDGSNENVLLNAGVNQCRICVIVISDITAIKRIIHKIKEMNPGIHLIVRTRFVNEMPNFYKMGADEVIPEEFETSIEIVARVMNKFLLPKQDIDDFIHDMRKDHYNMFRKMDFSQQNKDVSEFSIDHEISSMKVNRSSGIVGNSLQDINFRDQFNTNILAVRKGNDVITNPTGNTKINDNDILIVFGKLEDINYTIKKISGAQDEK